MAIRYFLLGFTFFVFMLVACAQSPELFTNTPRPTFTPRPTPPIISSPIPITDAQGEIVASQPGFVEWVLLSGVDEHGITFEHHLVLLKDADPDAEMAAEIHTGHPVIVHEIRHVGPQGLQRFYFVETLTGQKGWISDFYVRRRAYLFNIEGKTVPLYSEPGGVEIAQVGNVTPITLLEPRNISWWKVSSLDGKIEGWTLAEFVKESSEEAFLLGTDHEHLCPNCPYFFP